MRVLVGAVLLWLLCGSVTNDVADYRPRDGDLVFQVEHGGPSLAIQVATISPFNHVGVVITTPEGPRVVEALGRVSVTPLAAYLKRNSALRHRVMRLASHPDGLSRTEATVLKAETRKLIGLPYDAALRWSDDALNCSELVWKTYARALDTELSEPSTIGTVSARVATASGHPITVGERYVSPADLSRSGDLEIVWTNLPFESRWHRPWMTGVAVVAVLVAWIWRRKRV